MKFLPQVSESPPVRQSVWGTAYTFVESMTKKRKSGRSAASNRTVKQVLSVVHRNWCIVPVDKFVYPRKQCSKCCVSNHIWKTYKLQVCGHHSWFFCKGMFEEDQIMLERVIYGYEKVTRAWRRLHNELLWSLLLTKRYWGDWIKKNEMIGACGMCGGAEGWGAHAVLLWGNVRERDAWVT